MMTMPYSSAASIITVMILSLLLPQPNLAACPDVGSTMALSGPCTLANLKAKGCDPTTLGFSPADVLQICENSGVTFGSVTNNFYQFDKTHMDGGGRWNIEQNSIADALDLQSDAARIGRFASNVAPYARINWPVYEALNNFTDPVYEDQRRLNVARLNSMDIDANSNSYMSNFNLTDSCALNTVMCCFISNRLNTFVPNANACTMNLEKAKHSNHVQRGYGTYDSTTPAYCVGFTWNTPATDVTNRFKGNALFDVAYNTVFQKGYVENIPGAPMCGCLEQMPVVTKADCRQVKVAKEAYIVSRPSDNELVITNDMAKTSISYSDCASDLKTTAQTVFKTNAGKKTLVGNQLVGAGQCKTASSNFLKEKFWVPGDVSAFNAVVNPNQWTQVAGMGNYFFPVRDSLDDQDANFRQLLGSGPPYPLIYRICPSCLPSHRQIYYERLTEIPDDINFLNLFLNDFTTLNSTDNPNIIGQDFQLYSTLADATQQKNAWKYCYLDKNEDIGFPASCGPTTYINCQWNRYNNYMCDWDDYNAWLHGFFVQKK